MPQNRRLTSWYALAVAGGLLLLAGCQRAILPDAAPAAAPVAGVAAANPLAVDAGLEVLRRGGSAVDAAVAVQAMLGLVEPQSSGIGGGAFLLHFDAHSGRVTAFDGRETAPAAATPDLFIGADGKPLAYRDAVTSGRSTGVPGVMPMLGAAHQRHGRLPWGTLFDPAVRAAENGFTVPKRLARFVNGSWPQSTGPDVRALFSRQDGSPVQAGDTLRNPAYAGTLRLLAGNGPRALLMNPIAGQLIARTGAEPLPGALALDDLSAYQPGTADPVCGPFRVYIVCVPPPPSSGVSLLQ
ncbi:MAG TPA: gamma-glutamyltransferase, partial [Gammaproteobacteria bacterium]